MRINFVSGLERKSLDFTDGKNRKWLKTIRDLGGPTFQEHPLRQQIPRCLSQENDKHV